MTATDPHTEKRSWIFQAVPRYFDLTEALKHIRIFRWRIKQCKKDIRAGDDVFLWLAGSEGGMVARGRVITDPQIMEDALEELPFVKEEDQDEDRLFAAIEIDTVFDQPVQRTTLKAHSVLSSVSILKQTRGTNFPLTGDEADSLNELCPRAKVYAVSLDEAFARFRDNPVDQMRVMLRRKRAEQLRALLADVNNIDLDTFNRELWQLESATFLDGKDIRKRLFESEPPDAELCEQVTAAIEADTLELHGNYVWRMASSVYGSRLKNATDDEKEGHIRTALTFLNDSTLTATEKAEQINSVPGFGFTAATGLVMVYHPNDFAIWDKQSIGAFSKLHLQSGTLSDFQENAAGLKLRLGAEDYLEMDWFLYQINQGMIEVVDRELHEKMLRDIDDQIQANIAESSTASQTEKEQLVKSRIGQGQFRQNIQQFESACRVSGVNDSRFLIASHIKPWRSCDNVERLDAANGLFLSPNIDLLFDRGYISFEDDGTLLVASGLDATTLESLGVPLEKTKCGEFSAKQRKYLAYHRQHILLGSTD